MEDFLDYTDSEYCPICGEHIADLIKFQLHECSQKALNKIDKSNIDKSNIEKDSNFGEKLSDGDFMLNFYENDDIEN